MFEIIEHTIEDDFGNERTVPALVLEEHDEERERTNTDGSTESYAVTVRALRVPADRPGLNDTYERTEDEKLASPAPAAAPTSPTSPASSAPAAPVAATDPVAPSTDPTETVSAADFAAFREWQIQQQAAAQATAPSTSDASPTLVPSTDASAPPATSSDAAPQS